jgi:acyl transferase domain-containing protein/SAM-dependent methyltransferase/aryl carrier-like protein
VASLLKTILMMEHEAIPVQANHRQLNPKIDPLEPDRIIIPLATLPWKLEDKVACINNYGAAGSNAAMIVRNTPAALSARAEAPRLPKYPLYIAANSPGSLQEYCRVLELAIQKIANQFSDDSLLGTILFSLSQMQNPALPQALLATVSTLPELRAVLAKAAAGSSSLVTKTPNNRQPIVLVFGGQRTSFVGLSKDVFEASRLLQLHLRACNDAIQADGGSSIFPAIFQTEPVNDVDLLHSLFFSIQYACAKAWIDAGVVPDAVMGHSFGQLTALCIGGTLSLADAVRLVRGRAQLMQTLWGEERGSMILVQANTQTVQRIISAVQSVVEIACYNGPESHVLVGTEKAIDTVEASLRDGVQGLIGIKHKRLAVTHGFHSRFTEPILPGLVAIAERLSFKEPEIHLETCSDGSPWTRANPALIAEHTRSPVYFGQAVERLSGHLGPCTWLEAGAGSGITSMVRAALPDSAAHNFQAIQLDGTNALTGMVDATMNLWKVGHHGVQFWPFHRRQGCKSLTLRLPPYQFETTRHWLEWKDTIATEQKVPTPEQATVPQEPVFLAFVGYRDQRKLQAEFHVDTRSKEYQFFVKGHAVLAQPLCPAPLYVELAARAATILHGGNADCFPCVKDLGIRSPLGAKETVVSVILERKDTDVPIWTFSFSTTQCHAAGTVSLQQHGSSLKEEAIRYEKLIGMRRCQDIMADPQAEALQGALVYRIFGRVVTYADYYKGVQSVFARNQEVAGHVKLAELPVGDKTLLNPLAVDNFIQVSGLHVNSLTEIGDKEVYVCTQVDCVQATAKFLNHAGAGSWTVYSNFHHTGERELVNDIFVFDTVSNSLVFWTLGVRFTRVNINSLAQVLSRANKDADRGSLPSASSRVPAELVSAARLAATSKPNTRADKDAPVLPTRDLLSELRDVIQAITEVPKSDITAEATLEDLGVDSLMGTEVLNEINKSFSVSIPVDEFSGMTDVASVVRALQARLGIESSSSSGNESDSSETQMGASGTITPLSEPETDSGAVLQLSSLLATHLETSDPIEFQTNLSELGLDSLLSIELASDIKKMFQVDVDMAELTTESTFGDLVKLVLIGEAQITSGAPPAVGALQSNQQATTNRAPSRDASPILGSQRAFEDVRFDYDLYTQKTGFAAFWKKVYPAQSRLVLAYTVEAFAKLGCNLAAMKPGDRLPPIQYIPKHQKLVDQLYNILRDGLLVAIDVDGKTRVRSDHPVDTTPSATLLERILTAAPDHASEHKLLDTTGSKLADCLTGAADPLMLLFRSQANRDLLAHVYAKGPMYDAISQLLCSFLGRAFSPGATVQILELGGGTGGTTKHVVNYLAQLGVAFEYTFTDLSGSLVAAARKTFAGRTNMKFQVIDIEKEPVESLRNKFHVIISTNCIHATRNLELSTRHIRQMLCPGGFLSLVEFTRNMYWFDLVFGLLDGWWFFEDGREHVLATERVWDASMRRAGFDHVTWTDGDSAEAKTLRIITGFNGVPEDPKFVPAIKPLDTGTPMETIRYKQIGPAALFADIHYPSTVSDASRPIGEHNP